MKKILLKAVHVLVMCVLLGISMLAFFFFYRNALAFFSGDGPAVFLLVKMMAEAIVCLACFVFGCVLVAGGLR